MKKHAKLNLKKYEKAVTIRSLRSEDFDSVVELQKRCFAGMEPWTREQFESQISIFPEGQIGIEYRGKLVASSSSVILDFALYKDWQSWEEISDNGYIRNHNSEGNTLYGIEMMVDPSARGLKLARRLYDTRKQLARDLNLMRIVIGTSERATSQPMTTPMPTSDTDSSAKASGTRRKASTSTASRERSPTVIWHVPRWRGGARRGRRSSPAAPRGRTVAR